MRSEDIRADADRLDREEQGMVDLYVACTGKTEEEVRGLIAVDRFMSATEALAFGFATQSQPAQGQGAGTAAVQARLKTVRLAVARADKPRAHPGPRPRRPQPKAKTAAKPPLPPAPWLKK